MKNSLLFYIKEPNALSRRTVETKPKGTTFVKVRCAALYRSEESSIELRVAGLRYDGNCRCCKTRVRDAMDTYRILSHLRAHLGHVFVQARVLRQAGRAPLL